MVDLAVYEQAGNWLHRQLQTLNYNLICIEMKSPAIRLFLPLIAQFYKALMV
jgi:hypothetical protein